MNTSTTILVIFAIIFVLFIFFIFNTLRNGKKKKLEFDKQKQIEQQEREILKNIEFEKQQAIWTYDGAGVLMTYENAKKGVERKIALEVGKRLMTNSREEIINYQDIMYKSSTFYSNRLKEEISIQEINDLITELEPSVTIKKIKIT